ncbi:MAG: hypothetical protein ACRENE_12785 [Polyangiaceae bacterium]
MTSEAREHPRAEADVLSLDESRRLIGYLGLILPYGLYVLAGLRPTTGLKDLRVLQSVSAYYYTGAVALFTGVLVALSLFLWSYKGYKDVSADRIVGKIAGAAAACVALFPSTFLPALEPSWWRPWMGKAHYAAAVVLFLSFIVFALWLFRMTAQVDRSARPRDKKVRDTICLVCGITMIGAMIWAVLAAQADGSIFWAEALAIQAFAVSWLAKGEAHKPYVRAARRMFGRSDTA